MNPFIRECLLGGWHLLPEVQSERPKEVVREKPVWATSTTWLNERLIGESGITDSDTQCEAFKAAAQEDSRGLSSAEPKKAVEGTVTPAAAAPIDGFRVGSPLTWI